MAIFHSYVSLPEGTRVLTWLKTRFWIPYEDKPQLLVLVVQPPVWSHDMPTNSFHQLPRYPVVPKKHPMCHHTSWYLILFHDISSICPYIPTYHLCPMPCHLVSGLRKSSEASEASEASEPSGQGRSQVDKIQGWKQWAQLSHSIDQRDQTWSWIMIDIIGLLSCQVMEWSIIFEPFEPLPIWVNHRIYWDKIT